MLLIILSVQKWQLRKREETEERFPLLQNRPCVKHCFLWKIMFCIKFFPYNLKYESPFFFFFFFFSAVHCSACSSWRLRMLFMDNNNIYLWEDASFSVLSVGCEAITGEIFPCFCAAVNSYYRVFVIFWKIMQSHCGSKKLWIDFCLNGSNMHLNYCSRVRYLKTAQLFHLLLWFCCCFCSGAQNFFKQA